MAKLKNWLRGEIERKREKERERERVRVSGRTEDNEGLSGRIKRALERNTSVERTKTYRDPERKGGRE